jgi:hypothetical protein
VAGRFVDISTSIQRFLCPRCGVSGKVEQPETEDGFKLTVGAADEIERLVIDDGVTSAASQAGLDKSSVSRLIAARADRVIATTEPPPATALSRVGASALAASDIRLGDVRAVFVGPEDGRLLSWIGNGKATIFPDATVAAHCLSWHERIKTSLTGDVFRAMLSQPLRQAATRMAALIAARPAEEKEIARLLTTSAVGMSFDDTRSLSKIAAVGTPGRHFLKLKDRLMSIHDADSLQEASRKLNSWLAECHSAWADIFQPVTQFIKTYMPVILAHPLSLTSSMPILERRFDGPANVQTLLLARERRTSPKLLARNPIRALRL